MELRLLGGFDVVDGQQSVPLGGRRQRAVLLALALRLGQPVPIERLVEEVWDGSPPPSAAATTRRYLSHLRTALESLPAAIERGTAGYVLELDPDLVDAHRFDRLAREGLALLRADALVGAASRLSDALALWRGPAIADFRDESFARAEAMRLDELRTTCVEARFEIELRSGRATQAIPELEVLVDAHPLHEGLRGLLMRALHEGGRRPEALRVFASGRRILGEELGLEPSVALQDLETAILFQDPDLRSAPPAACLGNLPAEADGFVGRAVESTIVLDKLDRSRLVTLTGPGGSGKTRLALHVAAARVAAHADGAWLVDLTPLRDGSLVASAMADALGVRDEGEPSVVRALVAGLKRRDCLVVLDNCEHVLDAIADVVGTLLKECEGVRLLATSREPLAIAGEDTWVVPPMVDEDAACLFARRAQAVLPSFVSTAAEARINELCRRLDGIPLAIELAAARLRVLSIDELLERLDDRLTLLRSDARDVNDRQRTLRATVDWSYALLSDAERVLFDRLSVFAGSFDLAAASAVTGVDDVVDGLAGLVAKSLVARVDHGSGVARFRLIETLRQFGAERLAESEDAIDVVRRHADHHIAEARSASLQLEGPDAEAAVDRLELMHDDCRAALLRVIELGDAERALGVADALWRFWDYRFYVREGRLALERALAMEGGTPAARVSALLGLAQLAWLDDDGDASRAACEAGLRLAATLGSDVDRGRLLVLRSEVARGLECDVTRAREAAQEALDVLAGAGDRFWEAQAMRVLALVAWDEGDVRGAEVLATGCLERWTACGDAERIAGATALVAGLAVDLGDLDRAETLFHASLEGFRRAGEPAGAASAFRSLARIAWLRGEPGRALALAEESLRRHEELGFRRGIAESLYVMAQAALDLGDAARAQELASDALARFRDRGFDVDVVLALHGIARVALARGDLASAEVHCEEALDISRRTALRRNVAPVIELLAEVRGRQADEDARAALLDEAAALFEAMGNTGAVSRIAAGRGTALAP